MSYTPGPWRVDDEMSRAHHRYEEGTRVVSSADGDIAICETTRGWENPETSPSNARLIAAAPELLEAVIPLVMEYETMQFASLTPHQRSLFEALGRTLAKHVFAPETERLKSATDHCPAHPDGIHRYDTDAMTSREMLLSKDVRIQALVVPPKKCACGRFILPGIV